MNNTTPFDTTPFDTETLPVAGETTIKQVAHLPDVEPTEHDHTYHILFSYTLGGKKGDRASKKSYFGRATLFLTMHPNCHTHLAWIESHLATKNKIQDVVVHNWQLLQEGTPKVETEVDADVESETKE